MFVCTGGVIWDACKAREKIREFLHAHDELEYYAGWKVSQRVGGGGDEGPYRLRRVMVVVLLITSLYFGVINWLTIYTTTTTTP